VYRWDLRYTSGGPVLQYETPDDSLLWNLALEPHHGTVLIAKGREILCWDVKTGRPPVNWCIEHIVMDLTVIADGAG
jgi:hypothetical protein